MTRVSGEYHLARSTFCSTQNCARIDGARLVYGILCAIGPFLDRQSAWRGMAIAFPTHLATQHYYNVRCRRPAAPIWVSFVGEGSQQSTSAGTIDRLDSVKASFGMRNGTKVCLGWDGCNYGMKKTKLIYFRKNGKDNESGVLKIFDYIF